MIEDQLPAGAQYLVDAGEYVETRPAPALNDTQKLLRMCSVYLWTRKQEGNSRTLVQDIETYVHWDYGTIWARLRNSWGDHCQLEDILRSYEDEFNVELDEDVSAASSAPSSARVYASLWNPEVGRWGFSSSGND